jgi:hypothetical protein
MTIRAKQANIVVVYKVEAVGTTEVSVDFEGNLVDHGYINILWMIYVVGKQI